MAKTHIFTVISALLLFAMLSECLSADTFGSGANTFDIEFVPIGNPDNPDDTTGFPSPAGKVEHAYRIGKHEISEDMIDKANALGGLGITKDARGADKPATHVNWNEAARFVNWLNTISGFPPAYKFSTQPGGIDYDVNANIELWQPGDAGYDANNLFRNGRAHYFLPNADEWYKAAFYDPTANSGTGGYWDFPTSINAPMLPTPVASGTAAETAVYGQSPFAEPADVQLAGGLSPYGIMGLAGNVWEWNETEYDFVNDSSPSRRFLRGGGWYNTTIPLSSRGGDSGPPTIEWGNVGFRVASIPEPTSYLLAIAAIAVLPVLRREPTSSNRA